jgi:hypothetical protein
LQRKTIVGNLNKLWLDGRNGFWSAKVLVDNSSAEKALVLKQNQSKKAGGIIR